MSKKKKKLTKADLDPKNFTSQEENEAAHEQYKTQYNYFQFFFGDNNKEIKQQGKPNVPPYGPGLTVTGPEVPTLIKGPEVPKK